MRPKESTIADLQGDMFQVEMKGLINPTHPLIKLSHHIEWKRFDKALSSHYDEETGRPAIPTRMMVGLHYLKYTYDLSDEEVVLRWVENPYWQYFCGSKWFVYEFPIDASSMTRWRKKIGEQGVEELLRETVKVGEKTKVIEERSYQRVNVDTTVQEKAITFPTDARLYYKMRSKLVCKAKKCGILLRQSYVRVARKELVKVGRYGHARQFKRMHRSTRKLKTYLGRVQRDIERKISSDADLSEAFAEDIELARRLLSQKRKDKNKLYSIHAPEVECISKGKAHKRYEFGNKVGIVSTSREGFILAAKAFHSNPYDGHTLKESIKQAESISGRTLKGDIFTDRGYRKHDYEGPAQVHLAGRSTKQMSWSFKRFYKRRSAIEPLIGHIKLDGRMKRNYLLGTVGDQVNAILSACGQNTRLLLRADIPALSFLRLLWERIISSAEKIFLTKCIPCEYLL